MVFSSRIAWISIFIIAFSLLVSYVLVTQASSPEDIVYPVPELGGCKDEASCRSFCDQSNNLSRCLVFAEKHNLMSQEELEIAKKFSSVGAKGPGGCNSKESCETYCNNIDHIDECLSFAERHGFMLKEELEEAKKIQAALAGGAKLPGGCRNKNECEDYCQSGDHMEECLAFAEASGFLDSKELEEARRVLPLMRAGKTPGGCKSKEQCEAYCEDENNFEQCIAFAEEAGFMSRDEIEMAKKTGGKGPGGCRGRACMDFCEKEENLPVCIDFAIEHDLMKPEDAEIARKTGGKGPGGCRGKESCETFCGDPANQEVCFDFAQQHGLIKEEDLRRMQEGNQQIQGVLSGAPPQVLECLDSQLGSGSVDQLRSGDPKVMMRFGSKMEGVMRSCFEQAFGGFGGEPGGFPGGGEFPGGGATEGEFPGGAQGGYDGINVSQGQLGITVSISAKEGIESFSITPSSGSVYSGGLSSCPTNYKAETSFTADAYPLKVSIVDCKGNIKDYDSSSAGQQGDLPSGASSRGSRGFPAGGPPAGGFGGPGGCKTPDECRSYCRSHPEECQRFTPSSGGPRPGDIPRPDNLPQGSGEDHEEFPGKPEEFPFQGREEFPEQGQSFEGETHEGVVPPDNFEQNFQKEAEQQYQQQYQQEFQRQYEQQYQQQLQQQGGIPPSGGFPPPDSFPAGFTSPPTESFTPPPPTGESVPPPPPSSAAPKQSLLGNVLKFFLGLFR